jgi:hypothetical protein
MIRSSSENFATAQFRPSGSTDPDNGTNDIRRRIARSDKTPA